MSEIKLTLTLNSLECHTQADLNLSFELICGKCSSLSDMLIAASRERTLYNLYNEKLYIKVPKETASKNVVYNC